MEPYNPGTDLDMAWVESVRINLPAVKRRAETLGTKRTVKMQWQAAWLCRALTCIDLTTLSGDDTEVNVQRLCLKAAKPIRSDICEAIGMDEAGLTVGAVCVYPSRYFYH
jgi:deoxyribose-phosphate aldolase